MTPTFIYIGIGLLLIAMALARSMLARLPVSTAMIYLGIGVAAGPFAFDLFDLDAIREAEFLERVAEIAVLISLFASGLKLSPSWSEGCWHVPVRLAFVSMAVTVGLVTLFGVWVIGLPLGAAVLLGAVLAPTDPVLASDVQIERAGDREPIRFGLTGEAGLNDGSAFPFVMLGLGLLGLHELGPFGWRWFAVDLVWATIGGLAIGAVSGNLVGRLVLYLRSHHKEAVGLDEFLSLGLIALAYGLALLCHAYGFLAVFAAGLALRGIEEQSPTPEPQPVLDGTDTIDKEAIEKAATDPQTAPAYMTKSLLNFNTQLEHIGEAAVVMLLGVLLSSALLDFASAPNIHFSTLLWIVPALFLVIRPLAVWIGLLGSTAGQRQKALTAWFGIRGIGSIYYLMYAVVHGLPNDMARDLSVLVLVVVGTSIVVHGISVTPIMKRYGESDAHTEGGKP